MYHMRSTAKLVVMALSVLSLSVCVFASPGIDNIYYSGSSWNTVSKVAGVSYLDVTPDRSYADSIFAARADSGIDSVTTGIVTLNGNSTAYNALCTDPNNAKDFYAARAGGGIDHIYYSSGQWMTTPMPTPRTTIYMDIVADWYYSGWVFGASVDGGIDFCIAGGTSTTINSGIQYGALINDTSIANCVYGARINGGVDQIYCGGTTNINTTNTYVALTRDAYNACFIYGARRDGGIDAIYYGLPGPQWNTVSICASTKYTSLTFDRAAQLSIYAVRADGGADYIRYTGGWILTNINSTMYSAICSEATQTNWLYATRFQ